MMSDGKTKTFQSDLNLIIEKKTFLVFVQRSAHKKCCKTQLIAESVSVMGRNFARSQLLSRRFLSL